MTLSVDKKHQNPEESKVSIFHSGKFTTGADHTAWNRAYARGIALKLGVRRDGISEQALDNIMSHALEAVRNVLMTATHLCSHGRRTKLESRDVENSVNVNNSMFPFTSSRAPSNTQFHLSDMLSKSLYPNDRFVVDLRSIMNVPPRRMPFKRRIRKHWLVIEGEQPRVPENPVIMPPDSVSILDGNGSDPSGSNESVMEDGRAPRAANKLDPSASRPITSHALAVDQQVFFRKCVETVMGPCPEKRREVLHLLSSDPGLQSLVPRFALIIFEGVRCNIAQRNLPVLRNILRLLKTLIDNVQVNLDKCLHDIIPAVCSCVVCSEISADPDDKRHFRVREFAALILAMVCKRTHLADVRARITTLLCRVFTDSRANLASLYGALYALGELGCETVASVVFPRLELLRKRIASLKEAAPQQASDAERVTHLIEKMLARFVRRRKMQVLNELVDFQKAFPGFGEAVYKRIKLINERRRIQGSRLGGNAQQQSLIEGGGRKLSQTTTTVKRYPRLPQLPLRAPGIVRPTHSSVAKLRMFKYSQRHAGRGLFRQPPSAAPAQQRPVQPSEPSQQHLGAAPVAQQHPNVTPQNIRGPVTQAPGPLPAVSVEPAFPRRRPPTGVAEPGRPHPAVTVEPAYPRRPPGPPGGGVL
ncbi:hypothetical protein ANCCAN_05459 [Ancylostoma caninum]|uniref:TAF6 C-terminal HEAT repeat domain-containing protein n=1 Tax=Ancylostoma caninum TaxID=29170 RepID=A0A368GVX1_ANCCA|nr:hypothetical protein ANCCAN_05459 [Ancylostoma caninum]